MALGIMNFDATVPGHFVYAGERFEGAEQNASGFACGFAGHVEAVVIPVNEVDVGVTGWSEEHGSAGGVAGGRVGGGVVLAEVGFDFDDAGGAAVWSGVTDENFAQEFAGYAARTAGEKSASEGMDLGCGGRSLRLRHLEQS